MGGVALEEVLPVGVGRSDLFGAREPAAVHEPDERAAGLRLAEADVEDRRLVLGVAENWGSALFGTEWRHVVAFVLLVVILLFRPTGLLGESLGKARA